MDIKHKDMVILNNQDLTITSKNVNPKDLPKYWEREYIVNRISNIKNSRHRILMEFLWYTGVRVTEAVTLNKLNIDFDNYTLTIRWQKNRKWNYRNIPMHPRLKDLLQLYTSSMLSKDLVFPISRQRAWQLVKKYFDGHPHQFRHSFAVNWLRCDGDIIILSKMLGHAKVQSTMEYLKIVPIDQGKELMKISF